MHTVAKIDSGTLHRMKEIVTFGMFLTLRRIESQSLVFLRHPAERGERGSEVTTVQISGLFPSV